jgi:F-type H+-transporting ATPase subunit epsilon
MRTLNLIMAITVHLDIVSAEAKIFSGLAEMVIVPGKMGELGILPSHAPLLTLINPGPIRVIRQGGKEDVYYVSGGFLEVQPYLISILADTALRAADLDEAAAIESRQRAERLLASKKTSTDFSSALIELAKSAALLRTIKLTRKE